MKHIRMFENAQQAASILPTLEYNTLSAIRGESGISLKPGVPPTPSYPIPFYIDVRGPVTLADTSGLQMSTDGENWTDTVAGDLPTGKTYFRVASDQDTPLKPNWTEKSDSDYDIGGNINSLVKTSFEKDATGYNFSSYFFGKTKLKSAGNLILPARTLVNSCYTNMFYGCKSLTSAPELPATTLANMCYAIKCLAADISASRCTTNLLAYVAQTGTFVKNPSISESTWRSSTSKIPSGWTVEDAA